jgi:hypothetical protein
MMQLYRLIYYSKSALHVSGDIFAHHQEHLTVFAVSGSVHPSRCRLVSWMSFQLIQDTSRQVGFRLQAKVVRNSQMCPIGKVTLSPLNMTYRRQKIIKLEHFVFTVIRMK